MNNYKDTFGSDTNRLINDHFKAQVEYLDPGDLKPLGRSVRKHPAKQRKALRASIRQFGFVAPVLIDGKNCIIAGVARVRAAKELGVEKIPVVRVTHLTEAEIRALRIADNRLTELSEWDTEALAIEFRDLLDIDCDIEATGFEFGEIDILLSELRDQSPEPEICIENGPAVTLVGDIWIMNNHRVICGDATNAETYARIMRGEPAAMVFSDPPYNVPIDGHVSGAGSIKHREFEMAAGELTDLEFGDFLFVFLEQVLASSNQGALIPPDG